MGDDESEADAHRAQPADDRCGLAPGQLDLTDLPPPEVDEAPLQVAPVLTRATPVVLPTRADPIGRQSNWFVLGDRGLVRIDPGTGAPDRVFVPTGGCHLWSVAAGDGPEAASLVCPHGRDASSAPEPCTTVVVAIDSGATVARWETPDGREVRDLGLHDGQLIIAEASGAERDRRASIVRIDARTGEGTRTPVDVCSRSSTGDPTHVVDGTALVVVTCPDGPRFDLVLSGEGAVDGRTLGALQLSPSDIESDGDQVWGVGMDRFDATTLERVGPSHIDPSLLDQLIADGWGPGYGGAIEVPGALWLQRCARPCGPGPTTIELARLDLATGVVTDSWTAPGPPPPLASRDTSWDRRRPKLVAADVDGAWVSVGGTLVRLHRAA